MDLADRTVLMVRSSPMDLVDRTVLMDHMVHDVIVVHMDPVVDRMDRSHPLVLQVGADRAAVPAVESDEIEALMVHQEVGPTVRTVPKNIWNLF